MPDDSKSTIHRYYFACDDVFQRGDQGDRLFCTTSGSVYGDGEAMAKFIADALNAAIENEEHEWTGDGPSVAEAGGKSILIRVGDQLRCGEFVDRSLGMSSWTLETGARTPDLNNQPTGWRRMPKAR